MSPVNCLAGSKDLKRWFWGEKKLRFKRPKNSQIKVGLCWCHITEAMQRVGEFQTALRGLSVIDCV